MGVFVRRGKHQRNVYIDFYVDGTRMLNLAIDWKKATSNPVKKVKFLREERGPDRVLSAEEEEELQGECADHVRVAALLALNTGMRVGGILSLSRKNVDLDRSQTVAVAKSKNGKTRYMHPSPQPNGGPSSCWLGTIWTQVPISSPSAILLNSWICQLRAHSSAG